MLDDIKDKLVDQCIVKKLRQYKTQNEYSLADNFHTVDATKIFAAEYVKAYQYYYSKLWDYKSGQYRKGYSGTLFEKKGVNTTGMFKARAQADALNMPYRFYVWRCFEYYTVRNYSRLPRPTFLYRQEIVDYLVEQWQFEKDTIYHKKRSF